MLGQTIQNMQNYENIQTDLKYIQKQEMMIIEDITSELGAMKVDERSKELKVFFQNMTNLSGLSQTTLQECLFRLQIMQSDIQQLWNNFESFSTMQQLMLQHHQNRLWLELNKTAILQYSLELKVDRYFTPKFTCLDAIVRILQDMLQGVNLESNEKSFATLLILRDQLQHRSMCYSQVAGYVDEDIETMSGQEMERFELVENNYRENKGFSGWGQTFQMIRAMDFRDSYKEHQEIWKKSPKMVEAIILEYNKEIQKTVQHLLELFEPQQRIAKLQFEMQTDLLRQAEARREMLQIQIQLSNWAIQKEVETNLEIVTPYEDDWNGLEGIKGTLLQFVDESNLQIVTLGLKLLSLEYQDSLEKGDLQVIACFFNEKKIQMTKPDDTAKLIVDTLSTEHGILAKVE